MTEHAMFGLRSLVVTAASVSVTDESDTKILEIPIADIETARNEPLGSGGRMLVRLKSGEEVRAAVYTLSKAHLFSEAARGIEQLAKGEELLINLKQERTRCDKCGRLLPERDGVCPHCVHRGRTMMRILTYLKPYKGRAVVLATCGLLGTVVNLVPPLLQRQVVDGLTQRSLTGAQLVGLIGFWIGLMALGAGIQVAQHRLMTYLGTHISADLRAAVYRALQFLHVTYYDKKPVGAIASRVVQDTERIWFFLVDGAPFLVTNGLMLIGVLGFLFYTNWMLALAILAPIPLFTLISIAFWKPVANLFHQISQRTARLYMHLNETLSGVRVVKAFVKEDSEYERFLVRNREAQKAAMNADQYWYSIFGIMSFLTSLGSLINWGVGGWFVLQGKMTLGELIMVQAYLILIYGPLQWFAQVNSWFSRAMAGAERVFEVIDMQPEATARSGRMHEVEGHVEFRNVRFGYDKSNPVIKGVSFDVKPGEMIGLVGHSGAGKSTTINLIARFYEPDSGEIVIDGIDYRELDLQDFRRQIGIVLQEPFLFNGTIAENIAYGNPGASFEEIVEAARAANAHDFILAKPDGYDTVVGERGGKLSGGEKQRVSIARAILHNPKILILDEATSSVDVEAETQIQEAISRLISGRTTFAIAHRLSTLRNADRLLVLERGKIVEIGTHEELLKSGGIFAKLVETQAQINSMMGVQG